MNNELIEILQGCLVIPYSRETVERLETLCNNYVSNNEIDDNWIARCAITLFTRQKDENLKSYMEKAYMEQYDEQITIPSVVVNALMVYMISQAIDNKYEDVDSEFCSMALMNCVILLNGSFESMPFAKYLVGGYGKLQSYMKRMTDKFNVEVNSFSEDLFVESTQNLIDEGLNEELISVCKKLAADSWKYHLIKHLESYRNKNNSYSDYYNVVSHIVISQPYTYLYVDINVALSYLDKEGNADGKKKIREICEELESSGCSVKSCECESSIILRLMGKDEILSNLPFTETKLSKHDFGVYLYYELLMEKITADGTE